MLAGDIIHLIRLPWILLYERFTVGHEKALYPPASFYQGLAFVLGVASALIQLFVLLVILVFYFY